MKGYYFITDTNLSKAGSISNIQSALDAGARMVQYRNKTGTDRDMYEEASIITKMCKHIPFIINDRIDIALAVDSDGVHIGQDDLPIDVVRKLIGLGKLIGVTVHNLQEAIEAESEGATYVAVAPIYPTNTKADTKEPVGLELIKEIKKACKIPVIAIGGINLDNAPEVIKSGANMICAISAVFNADDIKSEIGKYQRLFD